MEPGGVLTEGGVIVGVVHFRLPTGRPLPIAIHYPDGRTHHVSCGRCADTRKVNGATCTACRPAPPRVAES